MYRKSFFGLQEVKECKGSTQIIIFIYKARSPNAAAAKRPPAPDLMCAAAPVC